LIKWIKNDDGLLVGELRYDYFDCDIEFVADESVDSDYIKRCALYLNEVTEKVIDHLCEASVRYCNDFLDSIGEKKCEFTKTEDILSLITPSCLSVSEPQKGSEPIVSLELDCEWEIEHGMEWVIREGKVIYVGVFTGTCPWEGYESDLFDNFA